MALHRLQNSFNAGEISPLVGERFDLDKHRNGCRSLENFLVKIYGGAFMRPGMEYLGAAKSASESARLVGFNFSTTTSFVLELGAGYIRFWSNGIQVEDPGSPGNALEVATPWTLAQVQELDWIQLNDVLYFTHCDVPVQRLTRNADDDWSLEEVEWDWPAMRDENITATTLEVSATTGTGVDLVASADTFEAGHVGAYFQIAHRRDSARAKVLINSSNLTSTAIRILGQWDVHTYGTWDADVNLERSLDGGTTWETIRTWVAEGERNIVADGNQESEALFRLRVANWTSSTSAYAILEAADSKVYGLVRVTAVTDAQNAVCDVLQDVESTDATTYWAESSWSDVRGYPRTVAFHEQRLIFGGCVQEPLRVWGSAVEDRENFRLSTLDDGAWSYLIASDQGNSILWLAPQRDLIIGTTGEEWLMTSGSDSAPITPTNVRVTRQSGHGSADVRAILINDVLLFVQRGARKVREFAVDALTSTSEDRYLAPDLTIMAEHVTIGKIKEWAFAAHPDQILWAVTRTGVLLGMTYERTQNVVAWHRHPTRGAVESVATIRGEEADEVWFLVKRVIEGQDVRYVERFDPEMWVNLDNESQRDLVYLDSAVVRVPDGSMVVSGLDHLEGEVVSVVVDGAAHPARTVVGGEITLAVEGTQAIVGMDFTATLQPTKFEVDMQTGSAQGRKFKPCRMALDIWKSQGGKVSPAPNATFHDIPTRDAEDVMDAAPPLFSGQAVEYLEGRMDDSIDVTLRQSGGLPLNVLSITTKFEVYGD